MSVAELIDWLRTQDPDAFVVLAGDREGNRCSPLDAMDACGYVAEADGTCRLCEDDRNERGERPAVVLWPVN